MNQLSTSKKKRNNVLLNYPFFFIVGRSGSGKDSLLDYVKENWEVKKPSLHIVQRYITRPAHKSEPFHSISVEKFKEMEINNQFAFTWFVYNTFYGVPSNIFKKIEKGDIVIINVSRSIIQQVKTDYPSLKVILVQIADEIAQERIQFRGRENLLSQDYQERLNRGSIFSDTSFADITISNSGELSEAGDKLLSYLRSFIGKFN